MLAWLSLRNILVLINRFIIVLSYHCLNSSHEQLVQSHLMSKTALKAENGVS